MPKLKATAVEQTRAYMSRVVRNIYNKCEMRGLSRSDICKINGWQSATTYHNRINKPEELKFSEIMSFAKFLKVAPTDLLKDPLNN